MMIATVANTITPCTIARSWLLIPITAVCPRPGRLNTVSVKMAPPRPMPMSIPSIVTTGRSALRRVWEKSTWRSGAPLARAVRTKSSFIVSMTLARIIRT
jgi:hypothetical protein